MSDLVLRVVISGYNFEVYSKRPSFELLEVNQVHGHTILNSIDLNSDNEADGILSLDLETPLAIKTADCLPIIVIGKKGVCLIHAGWRGVQKKIVQNELLKKIEPFHFYIGPHIDRTDFQVSEDFKNNFPNSSNFSYLNEKLTFNLSNEVYNQILEFYPEAKVQISDLSTYSDERFHSFRRDNTSQRNWNILSKRS